MAGAAQPAGRVTVCARCGGTSRPERGAGGGEGGACAPAQRLPEVLSAGVRQRPLGERGLWVGDLREYKGGGVGSPRSFGTRGAQGLLARRGHELSPRETGLECVLGGGRGEGAAGIRSRCLVRPRAVRAESPCRDRTGGGSDPRRRGARPRRRGHCICDCDESH